MKFKYNDGGREASGYKGKAGDCVARSIAIVAGLPYQEVYDALANGAGNERFVRLRSVLKDDKAAFKVPSRKAPATEFM